MRFLKVGKLITIGKIIPNTKPLTFWGTRKYATERVIKSSFPDVSIPSVSLSEYIWKDIGKWNQATALVCGLTGTSYTYGELQNVTQHFGNSLLRLGVRSQEVVGVISPNSVESAIAILGTIDVGGIITAINPNSTPQELARQLQNAEVKHVMTVPSLLPALNKAMDVYPGVQNVIVAGETDQKYIKFNDMVQHDRETEVGRNKLLNSQEFSVHDTIVLLSSSGTTGPPKGTMLTHYNILYIIRMWEELGLCRKTTDSFQEVHNVVLPFFHIYGMVFLLFIGITHGIKMALLPEFKPMTYLDVMDRHRPTQLHLVTPLFAFLCENPRVKEEYLENVNSVFYGGAPVGMTLLNKMKQKLYPRTPYFLEVYGMTECCPVTVTSKTDMLLGSCGKVAPNTRLKILDTMTGESLGPNQKGEICAQGPQIMKGYLNNPEATLATIRGDWVHTGDTGYYTETGHVFVVDRVKELIKVKGMQVAPSELEDLLRLHPAIEDAGVIGIPDEVVGEFPRAYIVKKDISVTESDIIDYIKNNVAPHKQLTGGVEFVDIIPKSASGKILRRELKEMIQSRK